MNVLRAVFCIVTVLASVPTEQPVFDDPLRRVYVYFSDLPMNDKLFEVSGKFYSADGKEREVVGQTLKSNGVSEGRYDDRFWCFDIPANSKTCQFFVNTTDFDSLWSYTNLTKIEGCTFEYSTPDYGTISPETGWHPLGLSMRAFCRLFSFSN